jgi:energy-coupling factor transport system permease protein
MEDFEILRNITIGQYLPGDSFLHRIDPRAKLVAFLLLVSAITFTSSYLGNALLLAVILYLVFLSGLSLRYTLKGIRPAMGMIIALALMQLFFLGEFYIPRGGIRTLFKWGFINITTGSVQLVFVSTSRFLELLLLTSLLTFTTTTTELTHGVESILRPLVRFGFPAHELSLILTIALRFVPILARELESIMKAQASRGADIGGGRLRFVGRARETLTFIVPLFVNALHRAEELILAMESRCYVGGKGRTRLKRFVMTFKDYIALASVGAFTVFTLTFPFPF